MFIVYRWRLAEVPQKKKIKIIIIIYNNNNDNNKIKCENKLINYMGNTFVDNFYLEKYINTK